VYFLDIVADFTALTIFEQFKKEPSTTAVERVLKKLAEAKAKEVLAVSHSLAYALQVLI
jgi:mitochondrial import receptor subunit TOM70